MATAGQDFDISPDQNLYRYLQQIRKYPMLEIEEERQLARRWLEHEDPEAACRLVNSHLRLVAKIAKGGAMARPHLARALVERGYKDSVQGVFDDLLAEGMPLYVPSPYVSVPEAIDLIHQFGGVAILAHPAHYGKDAEIPKWIQRDGLDGIEVKHPRHGSSDVERYTKMCESFGVLKTASSDFHGEAVAPERELGVTGVPDAWLDALREKLASASQSNKRLV